MRNVLLAVLIAAIASTAASAMTNEPDSWMGWAWGTTYESLKDKLEFSADYVSKLPSNAKSSLYLVKGASATFFGHEWKAVAIGFMNGTLCGAYIGENRESMIVAAIGKLEAAFGKSDHAGSLMQGMFKFNTWTGEKTAVFALEYKNGKDNILYVFLGTKEYVKTTVSGFMESANISQYGL